MSVAVRTPAFRGFQSPSHRGGGAAEIKEVLAGMGLRMFQSPSHRGGGAASSGYGPVLRHAFGFQSPSHRGGGAASASYKPLLYKHFDCCKPPHSEKYRLTRRPKKRPLPFGVYLSHCPFGTYDLPFMCPFPTSTPKLPPPR